MSPRPHDTLFAAAGVTAALSLIGAGVTMLNGSVLHFDAWPSVVGDPSPRAVALPVLPAERGRARTELTAANLAPSTVRLPAIGGVAPAAPTTLVRSLALTVPAPSGTTRPKTSAPRSLEDGPGVTLIGAARALGDVSSTVDGGTTTGGTGTTRSGAGAGAVATDTDGDGTPESWVDENGKPVAGPDALPGTPAAAGGRNSASAFTADPAPAPAPEPAPAPAPEPTPPAADPTPEPEPVPPADVAEPTTPAPAVDPTPAEPAPSVDPAPETPSSDVPPAPQPAAEPKPAEAAPPADAAPGAEVGETPATPGVVVPCD